MELVIQILMLFILINTVLKLSFWKLWQVAIFSLLCGGFIIWACQYAILQSKTQLEDYLTNTKIMQDSAVLITAESAICFAFCFAALRNMFGRRKKDGCSLSIGIRTCYSSRYSSTCLPSLSMRCRE
ncbi:MAG: hypothetical protein LUE93_01280 [Bacteroides sp.]|nr:hypothetical protein [Bacteroides sp.]